MLNIKGRFAFFLKPPILFDQKMTILIQFFTPSKQLMMFILYKFHVLRSRTKISIEISEYVFRL